MRSRKDVMNETRRIVAEAMSDVEQAVPPYPYRLFLKVMTLTIGKLLNEADDRITRTAVFPLNCLEMNFCALDTETSTVRHLIYLLGFEEISEDISAVDMGARRHSKFVMLDLRSSRCTLRAFLELSTEEITCLTIPGVTELEAIDSLPCLIAHLGYNIHLRLELMLLLSKGLMPVMEEDVHVALKCIEHLATRFGILTDGGPTVAVWELARAMVIEYLASRGSSSEVSVLREILKDVAVRFTAELSLKVPHHLINILLFTNSMELTVRVTDCRVMLDKTHVQSYLRNFSGMPKNFVSNRFLTSFKSMERLMTRSLECELTDGEVEEVYKLAVWQARHFIHHVQPDAVLSTVVGYRLETGSSVDPYFVESMLAAAAAQQSTNFSMFSSQLNTNARDHHQPFQDLLAAESNEEKEKQDMCEKEKTANDHDSSITQEEEGSHDSASFQVAPASFVSQGTDSREHSTTRYDESVHLISMLNDSIESVCSSDVLVHIELDINGMYEKSNYRKAELESNIRELNDVVVLMSSPVAIDSLKEKIEEMRHELEHERRLLVDLEKLQVRLDLKKQLFAHRQPPVVMTLLPVSDIQHILHSVLVYHQQQGQLGFAVLLQLLVRSLPLFSYDDLTLIRRKLRMVPQNPTCTSNTEHVCFVKEIADHCSQLIRHLVQNSQCPL